MTALSCLNMFLRLSVVSSRTVVDVGNRFRRQNRSWLQGHDTEPLRQLDIAGSERIKIDSIWYCNMILAHIPHPVQIMQLDKRMASGHLYVVTGR